MKRNLSNILLLPSQMYFVGAQGHVGPEALDGGADRAVHAVRRHDEVRLGKLRRVGDLDVVLDAHAEVQRPAGEDVNQAPSADVEFVVAVLDHLLAADVRDLLAPDERDRPDGIRRLPIVPRPSCRAGWWIQGHARAYFQRSAALRS